MERVELKELKMESRNEVIRFLKKRIVLYVVMKLNYCIKKLRRVIVTGNSRFASWI